MFVQADGAIDQYAAVKISDDGQAAMLTTTNAGSNNLQVGVAQVAAADDEYLWVWVGGIGGGGVGTGIKGKAAASYAADANLNTTHSRALNLTLHPTPELSCVHAWAHPLNLGRP